MTRPPRPTAVKPDFDAIPAELREGRLFVVWQYTWKPDKRKWDKPPSNARTGGSASTTDPETWSSFEEAVAAYQGGGWDGIGRVVTKDDEIVFVDLDHGYDPAEGRFVRDLHADIVGRLDSYAEQSPGGDGAHVLVRGKLTGRRRVDHKLGFEVYDVGRYYTLTGRPLNGHHAVEERSDALADVCRLVFGDEPAEPAKAAPNGRPVVAAPMTADDEELLVRACGASNGAEFASLYYPGSRAALQAAPSLRPQ